MGYFSPFPNVSLRFLMHSYLSPLSSDGCRKKVAEPYYRPLDILQSSEQGATQSNRNPTIEGFRTDLAAKTTAIHPTTSVVRARVALRTRYAVNRSHQLPPTGAAIPALTILGRWSPANYSFIHIYNIHHVSKFMHACSTRATPFPHLVVHRLYDCRTSRQINSNVRCVYVSVVYYTHTYVILNRL